MASMTRFLISFAVSIVVCAASDTEASEVCRAGDCTATMAAAAAASSGDEKSMSLLQMAAADRGPATKVISDAEDVPPVAKSAVAAIEQKKPQVAAADLGPATKVKADAEDVPPVAKSAVVASEQKKTQVAPHSSSFVAIAAAGNKSAGRAVRRDNQTIGTIYGPEGTCEKITGGTCFSGTCDASRNAVCNVGFCSCSDYTCSNSGVCEFSISEVASAAANGVTNIGEQLTAVASAVPGVSTAISGISGTLGSVGTVVGEVTGLKSGCGQWVTTCVWSACPDNVGLTADCNAGLCMCKDNFCYSSVNGEPWCTVDYEKVAQVVGSMTR